MPYELLIERRAEKDLKKLEVSLFPVVIEKIKIMRVKHRREVYRDDWS